MLLCKQQQKEVTESARQYSCIRQLWPFIFHQHASDILEFQSLLGGSEICRSEHTTEAFYSVHVSRFSQFLGENQVMVALTEGLTKCGNVVKVRCHGDPTMTVRICGFWGRGICAESSGTDQQRTGNGRSSSHPHVTREGDVMYQALNNAARLGGIGRLWWSWGVGSETKESCIKGKVKGCAPRYSRLSSARHGHRGVLLAQAWFSNLWNSKSGHSKTLIVQRESVWCKSMALPCAWQIIFSTKTKSNVLLFDEGAQGDALFWNSSVGYVHWMHHKMVPSEHSLADTLVGLGTDWDH